MSVAATGRGIKGRAYDSFALRQDDLGAAMLAVPIPPESAMTDFAPALAEAQAALAAALAEAGRREQQIAAVVVDRGGHIVAAARMDGVGHLTLEIARRRAAAALHFGEPTREPALRLGRDPAEAAQLAGLGEILVQPGGFPWRDAGAVVGALGIAGAGAEDDHAIGDVAIGML